MPPVSSRTNVDRGPSHNRRCTLSKHYARRDLLSIVAGGGALAVFGGRALAQGGAGLIHRTPRPEEFKLPAGAVMPKRKLGRSGVEVSMLGLGGFHIGKAKDDETATRIVRTAIDHGVTFLDNCWDYNDGKSHERMGKALRDGYRRKVFLMTKIDGRTRESAAAQIDQSLRQLETDVIDLMQIHEVIRPEDPGRVFGPNGAMEALVAARKAGKVRLIGFTGHKSPDIHLAMLAAAREHRFDYDTVQMPVNVMDAHYQSFGAKVLPVANNDGVGVLAMKPFGSGVFFKSAALGKGKISTLDCLQYPMSLATSVVITGCEELGVLMQALHAALTFDPAKVAARRDALLARTDPEAEMGKWERYKTSEDFDGTTKHPWWLDTASLKKS
jgi:aryl-alcohol dehydrogenase-like predicted oxidoreductase